MSEAPLFDPAGFRLPPGIAHVCAGGETAALRSHDEALLRYVADKSRGFRGRTAQEAQIEAARAGVARLWKTVADIGFVSNVAEGVSIVAESLDWRAGNSIAIDANEYPSVVAPIAFRRSTSISLRQARGIDPNRLSACVDGSTRIIAASYVSYLTGERVDLRALRRVADSVGALLLVDFTRLRATCRLTPYRRLRLLGLLQMDARYHRRRRCLLEPNPPAWLDTRLRRLAFNRRRGARL